MLTFDGLVDLVPQLIEPAPLGFPLGDHVLHKKGLTMNNLTCLQLFSSPDGSRRKFFYHNSLIP